MININELRRLTLDGDLTAIQTIIIRLERAEKTNSAWLRANAPGGWIDDLRVECDALRAKIKAMERQEPVKTQHRVPFVNSNGELVGYSVWIDGRGFDHWPHRSLYLAPGAQPAPSVRPAALYPVISWLRNGCDPMKAAVELEMLTAAQEAKP